MISFSFSFFKTAIFDRDKTLTNTKKAAKECFKKVFGQVGSIASDRFTVRPISTGTRKALEDMSKVSDVKVNDGTLKTFWEKG